MIEYGHMGREIQQEVSFGDILERCLSPEYIVVEHGQISPLVMYCTFTNKEEAWRWYHIWAGTQEFKEEIEIHPL